MRIVYDLAEHEDYDYELGQKVVLTETRKKELGQRSSKGVRTTWDYLEYHRLLRAMKKLKNLKIRSKKLKNLKKQSRLKKKLEKQHPFSVSISVR